MLKKIVALLLVVGALFSFTGCGNKTDSWDVTLVSYDNSSKIKVIKGVRELTELGLKEAKELTESAPVVIAEGKTTAEANEIKVKFEEAGAVITLSPSK